MLARLFVVIGLLTHATAAQPTGTTPIFVSVSNDARLDGPTFAKVKASVLKELEAEGAPVRDISEAYRALFSPGMVAPTFDRPVPSALHGALAEDWERAQRSCREKMTLLSGDPSASPALRPQRALRCQQDAMLAVYARFLERERPKQVLAVQVLPRRAAPGTSRILVVRVLPARKEARRIFKDVDAGAVAQQVGPLVRDALSESGGGTSEPWNPRTTLPTVGSSPLLGHAPSTPLAPLPLPRRCVAERLPRALELDVAAEPLSDALVRRYAASVGKHAQAPALTCRVVAIDEAGAPPKVRAGLLCDPLPPVFTVQAPELELLTRPLLESLLANLCAPPKGRAPAP